MQAQNKKEKKTPKIITQEKCQNKPHFNTEDLAKYLQRFEKCAMNVISQL